MSINLSVPSNSETSELKPRITVIGVGGAGGNAVNNMIALELEGVDFIVANTDAQALAQSRTDHRIQMGNGTAQGLGAGAQPEIGRTAAEEALDEVLEKVNGSNMVFIAAGMGGGTGTGGAPVIARATREKGILTVGVVTKPFHFEGANRMAIAEKGVEELGKYVDTLIVIPNQNLFRIANEKTTFADAFRMADDVLYSGVRGVTDLMVMPGLINLDFADIRSIMGDMGKAMMGTGEAEGERRSLDAAEAAISNPLLDDITMKGAKGVLINITGGQDMTLFEVDEAANRIREEVDVDAFINFGSTFDDGLEGKIRVSVVATGMDAEAMTMPAPTMINLAAEAARESMAFEEGEAKTANPVIEENQPAAAMAEENSIPEADGEPLTSEADEAKDNNVSLDEDSKEIPFAAETKADGAEEAEEAEDEDEDEEPPLATEDETPPIVADTGAPPPATPSIGAVDAFIPKAPVIASDKKSPESADPFAAAAMANGGGKGGTEDEAKVKEKPAKSKGLSLFERVTGSGRAAKSVFSAKISNLSQSKTEPIFTSISSKDETMSEDDQKQLDGLESNESLAASQVEEDLLDIPAFLRRQAN